MTLLPGDIIATGTPEGVGAASGNFLKAGDRIEAEVARYRRRLPELTAADVRRVADAVGVQDDMEHAHHEVRAGRARGVPAQQGSHEVGGGTLRRR